MTVGACIEAYKRVAAQAFTPKSCRFFPASPRGAFSAKALESAMKQIIRENCVEKECRERRSQGSPTGQTCCHDELPFYKESAAAKTYALFNHEILKIKKTDNPSIVL